MTGSARPRVKICGITRAADAELAVRLGADAVGFVLWDRSPRHIDPARAGEIAARLPALVTRVAVVVDVPATRLAETVAVAGCDVAQLHGDETLTPYRATGRRLVRAVSLASDADVDAVLALPSDVTVLVDAEDKTRRGGTGLKANWPLAARVARERPIILAGGLRAENVGDAIACVKPWAIDVSSGVEEAPGIKSPTLLAAFFEAYAAALSEFRILNSAFRNGRT